MIKFLSTLAAITVFTASAQATFVDGIYQKMTDEKTCLKTVALEDENGPGYIEYVCPGPVEGMSLNYLTGGDWDNVSLTIDAKTYDFWAQIGATGTFSGFGNPNGIVEWVGKNASQGAIEPIALIIRYNGDQMDSDGNSNFISQLAVYGIDGDKVCFKGFTKGKNENAKARELAKKGKCLEQLVPSAE